MEPASLELAKAAEAHYSLGDAFYDLRQLDRAIECYGRAVELNPAFVAAHYNLGAALKDQGKLEAAVEAFQRALQLAPDFAEARFNLGYALRKQWKLDEAAECFRRLVELRPQWPEAHSNLGDVLHEQGSLSEAAACYRRALELQPQFAEASNNLGNTLLDERKLNEAAECFSRALALRPDFAEAHFNQSLLMLLCGDFEQGWPAYEWRWRAGKAVVRDFQRPRWDGGVLAGKSILLHAEQGLGDTLQFVRYAALVKQSGATVFVECHGALLPLLRSCSHIDRLIARGDELPEFDVHAPLLSVPGLLKTTLKTIPADIPYLIADAALIEQWRERLRGVSGFWIGINWRSKAGRWNSQKRNIPLECFASHLSLLPGVTLVSLQRGGHDELACVPGYQSIVELDDSVDEEHGAFMDTAAIMMNLDLVITSDTAVAHVAGALGVPVWTVLPFAGDWRWLLDRNDSPWYPTMRLFRQRRLNDWNSVFSEIRTALHDLVGVAKR